MLAKVFKKDSAPALVQPYFIPEIGAPAQNRQETGAAFMPAEAAVYEAPSENEFENVSFTQETSDDFLQTAREEAEQIIVQAEREKELIEQAARENALREAESMIEAEVVAQTEALRSSFAESLLQLDALRSEIASRVELEVVELALEIAKKIVGREVMFDREIALTLVKVSLKKIHSRALAEVHLNPEDLAYVESHRDQLDFRGSLAFVEDRSVSPGGCLIHTETGDVDARIESQFEEIAHGLLGK